MFNYLLVIQQFDPLLQLSRVLNANKPPTLRQSHKFFSKNLVLFNRFKYSQKFITITEC